MSIHVDFTPMVDMNMLLITFFMLCTTMIKSQTLTISLPSNEKVEQQEMNKAKESEAITLILTTDRNDNGEVKKDDAGRPMNTVYFYEGMPEIADTDGDGLIDNNKLKAEQFIGNDGKIQQGIRKILHDRNKLVLDKIEVEKARWRNKEFAPAIPLPTTLSTRPTPVRSVTTRRSPALWSLSRPLPKLPGKA